MPSIHDHAAMPETRNIVPVLLGSGANAYGLARGFHTEFGVRSLAVGPSILIQCRDSRFVDTRVLPGVDTDEGFVPALHNLAKELRRRDPAIRPLVVACGDTTAALLARHRDTIRRDYLTSSVDGPTLDRLVDKATFWEICRKAGIDTPTTAVYSLADHRKGLAVPEPDRFPLVLKPADSVQYLSIDFPGRRKAYVIESRDELASVAEAIYDHGYTGSLVIQEHIPGDDTQMRTLNAYVNSDGSVAMMCLGNPVMEECSPAHIGYYAAVVSGGDDHVYAQCLRLLRAARYTGYVNFDIKVDPRDGGCRFLELNPRPGGSSDYVSQAGFNLARWIWNDLVEGRRQETQYCHTRHLWLGVPKFVLRRYAPEGPIRDEALELIRSGRYSRSAVDPSDMSPRRALHLLRWQMAMARDFHRYGRSS